MPGAVTPHNSWAEIYDEVYERSFGMFYSSLTETTLEVVRILVPQNSNIIDFGAGTGRLVLPLSRDGYNVTAVEPSEKMLEQLQKKDLKRSVKTFQATMESYKGDPSDDLALCVFTVILYILDTQSLKNSLQSVYDSLKQDGLLLIDIPMKQLFQGFHYEDELMRRDVGIERIDRELYQYKEVVRFLNEGQFQNYFDEFTIRHWGEHEVIQALENIGFQLVEDLSEHFLGSGSKYLLFRK